MKTLLICKMRAIGRGQTWTERGEGESVEECAQRKQRASDGGKSMCMEGLGSQGGV